ncbi:MAG TPA: hypothetical protein VK452_08015 [Dissulfurispiraceae bacterium]|nr:hypothetical protein [Dissulfurispiraceae bacterium]
MKAALAVLSIIAAAYVCISSADAVNCAYAEAAEIGTQGFYHAASDYYRIPEHEIVIIRERKIRDEEVPVVLFIARKARVPYAGVLDMRDRGMSWMDITRYYRLNPEIYFAPARGSEGSPYGKAYGYYKKDLRNGGLDDSEIVNLVNIRFISRRYGFPPEGIIRMRSAGRSFVIIHEEIMRRESINLRGNREIDSVDKMEPSPGYR